MRTILVIVTLLCGCGMECTWPFAWLDEDVAACVSKYGDDQVVTCYSEGRAVYQERTRGEVLHNGPKMLFVEKRTGKHALVTGNCIATGATP